MSETLTPQRMSKDERSMLLYAECCVVDHSGLLECARMNNSDFEALEKFKSARLLDYGRAPSKSDAFKRGKTHWVTLYDSGWQLAHQCRRVRSEQIGPMRKEVDVLRQCDEEAHHDNS